MPSVRVFRKVNYSDVSCTSFYQQTGSPHLGPGGLNPGAKGANGAKGGWLLYLDCNWTAEVRRQVGAKEAEMIQIQTGAAQNHQCPQDTLDDIR